jgi:DNA (cytosine-5)-methyltransferase 1
MTHGSLFSGIGGFDLAAEWMGWENKFHCEWNPFCQKVLKHYWPEAESFNDITKTNFTKYANKIDILTGGFPCQPYSLAGKRKGKEDDRHLWPEMCRAIGEIKPRWVVGENVLGLVNWNGGLVFHEVQSDLEAQGYEVWPYVLAAAAIGAPHRRDRVFFIAYSDNASTEYSIQARRNVPTSEDDTRTSSYSDCIRCGRRDKQSETNQSKEWKIHKNEQQYRNGVWSKIEGYNTSLTNSNCERISRTTSNGIQEMERIATQQYAISPRSHKRTDWLDFPTVSPICDGNDGIPNRLDSITFPKWRRESIKAGGNAIVPQVALQIFKAIQEYENKIGPTIKPAPTNDW